MGQNESVEIKYILGLLLSKWPAIIISALLLGALVFGYSTYFVTPMYSTGASIYVNNKKTFQYNSETTEVNDLAVSEKLVPTYMAIVKSKSALSKVIKQTGLDYTVGQLFDMITTTPVEETGIFNVVIKCDNPNHAALIVNTIADVATKEIENYVEGTSAKIIDYAGIPASPSEPNIKLNTVIGFVLGLIISMAVILLIDLFDVRIKTEDDLVAITPVPVLGVIPEVGVVNGHARTKKQKKNREDA